MFEFSTYSSFKLKDIKDKTENIKIFKKKGIELKNILDALKWHCSFYWRYMLSNKNIKNLRSSSSLLDVDIAIPILLKQKNIFL